MLNFCIIRNKLALIVSAIFAFHVSPAFADNANTSVLCGYQAQDSKTGTRVGIFYRNDLTEIGRDPEHDPWYRSKCDGGQGHEDMFERISNIIVQRYGSTLGWQKQRYETTWADRCNDSDPVALFFGTKRSKCPAYVTGQVNYANSGEATPHDLLSCMANNHLYEVVYEGDGKDVKFLDLESNKFLNVPDRQINCTSPSGYADAPVYLNK